MKLYQHRMVRLASPPVRCDGLIRNKISGSRLLIAFTNVDSFDALAIAGHSACTRKELPH